MSDAELIRKLREENAVLHHKLMSVQNICPFCKENQADLLCDAVIGIEGYIAGPALNEKDRRGHRYFKGLGSELYTCDMAICESCREHGTPIFFGGHELKDHSIFVPDFCPIHHNSNSFGNAKDVGPLLESEAVAWRNRAKIAVQMDSWKKVSPYPTDAL
jgi:hypothetical protein